MPQPDRLLAEFATPAQLAAAIRGLQEQGYRRLEAYLPYPAPEVDRALGGRPSRLPVAVFLAGMGAAGFTYFLQWYLIAYLYPLDVGGRPPHFPLAYVVITFEMGVLGAALLCFAAVLALGRLVRLTDDVQSAEGFESATGDRFWLEVSAGDPAFHVERTRAELSDLGALRIEASGGGGT
jgi:hypothetical protein